MYTSGCIMQTNIRTNVSTTYSKCGWWTPGGSAALVSRLGMWRSRGYEINQFSECCKDITCLFTHAVSGVHRGLFQCVILTADWTWEQVLGPGWIPLRQTSKSSGDALPPYSLHWQRRLRLPHHKTCLLVMGLLFLAALIFFFFFLPIQCFSSSLCAEPQTPIFGSLLALFRDV